MACEESHFQTSSKAEWLEKPMAESTAIHAYGLQNKGAKNTDEWLFRERCLGHWKSTYEEQTTDLSLKM